jgi:hypothetical protein
MTVRRFGPVLGAGVQVEEKEGDKQILPAPLGVSVFVGEFPKGPVGEPGFPSGVLDYKKRYGSRRLPNSEAPGAVLDFYSLGQGAGEVIPFRVTAGDENQSIINLYNRKGVTVGDDSGRGLLGTLKAKNGGEWGGQRDIHVDEHTGSTDLTATTLDTGDTMLENQWAGGTLDMKKVTTKTYKIISNTAAGVISVEADQDLLADYNAGTGTPIDRYVLTKENVDYLGNEQHLAVKIKDGEENPTTEFAIEIYEDGALVKQWNNLNTDPTKSNYWVNVINDDKSNYWVVATDLYTGDKTVASVMPSNYYGLSKTLTATTLTLPDPDIVVGSVGTPDPTFVMVLGSKIVSQTITGTVSNTGADIDWVTTAGPLSIKSVGFDGVAEDLGDELINITVTNGVTPLIDGDTITITVIALKVDEAKGGTIWPDKVNEPNLSFIVDSNTRTTVSVRTGLDLTNGAAISAGEEFELSYNQQMVEGYNGSPISDSDYLPAFDPNLSKLNRIFGKNKGLVKITTPGVTSTAITKDGLEYAASRNYQYLVEFPVSILTEADAIDHINTTIGRIDYGFCYFPSWGSVLDPNATPGTGDVPLLQVSLAGMILGRHALVARNYNGYHKAPADTTVTLPSVLELPTGDAETENALNEELLNPKGINVVKFRQGTVIVWGDRTISPTSEWQWLHQRSLMSHYENILRENFDWIVFALNDITAQERLKTTLVAYFLPEWIKGALRGDTFKDAFNLKIDEENNNDLTRSQGDLNAEMLFRLADTVERFKMVVGKQGIFDAVV